MKKPPFSIFTQFHSLPEAQQKGFYPGVLVIENGPAKGHYAAKDGTRVVPYDPSNSEHKNRFQIFIDTESLDDVVSCGNAAQGGVKCKLDHGSTVRDIVGYYTNFRRDGDSVRADLTLLENSPHRPYVEEIISKMANKFGNSIDFIPAYEIKGENAVARCKKLNSVDVVDSPAATNSFFEEQPTQENNMPLSADDIKAVSESLAPQFAALRTEFGAKVDALTKRLEEGDDKDDKDDKEKKDKEDEAKLSATVEKATLSAIEKIIPKAKLESLANFQTTPSGVSDMEAAITAQLAAGAPDRGVAMQRIARDKPAIFNAYMKSLQA